MIPDHIKMLSPQQIRDAASFIYVAGPYTHEYGKMREIRFTIHEEYTAKLVKEGRTVYSPIVHFHRMAINYNFPAGPDFWYLHLLGMLLNSSELHVLKIPGWKESRGTQFEIAICKQHAIPIQYIEIPFS